MRDQFQLWLIPPLLLAVLSIWFRRKLTFEFGWPLFLQAVLVISTSCLGLFVGPKPLWAIVTWLLLFCFLIYPTLHLRRCDHLYSILSADQLIKAAHQIPLFYWGKLGKFWRDIHLSYACYIKHDAAAGDAIVDYWQAQSLPAFFEESLETTRLAANGLLSRWDETIKEFYRRESNTDNNNASFCLQACRAFAEKGNVEMATQCLKSANLANQRMDQKHLSLIFLQYFALAGSEKYTDLLSAKLAVGATPSMRLIYKIWSARCLIALGKYDEATEALEKLLIEVRSVTEAVFDSKIWTTRLENYLATVRNAQNTDPAISGQHVLPVQNVDDPGREANIEAMWRIYENTQQVQQVVLPKRKSAVVNLLLVSMLCVYFLSGCVDLIDNPLVLSVIGPDSNFVKESTARGEFMFRTFYVQRDLVASGQYYRLVTYIFLHGNLSHLLLNAFGLYWFGRIAAGIYGPGRFLIIFLVAGIVGGLAQITVSEANAVGASGAVFGVFSAVAVAIFRLRELLPKQMRLRELRSMIVMAVAQVGLDRVVPQVAGYCHLGGLVAGLIVGILLFPKEPFKNVQKKPV